jgi:NAD(P)-dependent dehydrogenase (short-subunit alcohol dehydrogenase family)
MAAQESLNVLITGGTEGLGRAGALRMAARGYRVFATGRSAERREQLAALAREKQLPVTPLEMDVRDEDSVARALENIHAQAGPLDVLVNNAGVGYYAVMEEIRMEHLREQMETNFFAAVRLIQRVLPEMRARRRGRIINISSIAGKLSFPLFGPYSASKFALEAMSDALRSEVYPFGIDVVLIEPGFIPTGFQSTASELSGEYVAGAPQSPYAGIYRAYGKSYRQRTRGTKATPEDFARVLEQAVTAASPAARYTVTPRAYWLSLFKRWLPDAVMDARIRASLGIRREA